MRELGLTEVRTGARLGDRQARPDLAGEDRRRAACTRACPSSGFRVGAPSLEDVFVSLTGEGFDVSG